jgi:hypothetical protein
LSRQIRNWSAVYDRRIGVAAAAGDSGSYNA